MEPYIYLKMYTNALISIIEKVFDLSKEKIKSKYLNTQLNKVTRSSGRF